MFARDVVVQGPLTMELVLTLEALVPYEPGVIIQNPITLPLAMKHLTLINKPLELPICPNGLDRDTISASI